MRRLLSLVVLAAVAVPAAAQAQGRTPRPRVRDSVRAFGYSSGPEGVTVESFRRGRLGLLVDLSADPARDSVGALVAGVTPGGPADRAGVRTGDLVVRFNGTRLSAAASQGADDDQSRPGARLIELASRLDTGDTVHLELRRNTRPVNVTIVAGPSGMEDLVRRFRVETMPHGGQGFELPGGQMFVFSGTPLASLELVKVNPGLGEYFGTSEGLLVADAPQDSSLGLKAGDVILSIGGRRPGSPAHAMSILGTYEPNESVTFEVMRHQRRITVTGKMPERAGWRASHDSFEFDLPFEFRSPRLELLRELPRMMIRLPPLPLDRSHGAGPTAIT
jgi:membrane-associated protease RseP (regulator of RpoE activity)